MSRHTNGSKRRGAAYARHTAKSIKAAGFELAPDDLARAWVAGYAAGTRAERKKYPRAAVSQDMLTAEERAALAKEFKR